MITGFHHTALTVSNIEEALRFYCDELGFTVVDRGRWADSESYDAIWELEGSAGEYAMLQLNDAHLEIFRFDSPESRSAPSDWRVSDLGITHLCFSVDDIASEFERLTNAGVTFACPPIDADGLCAFGSDPFGNVIELYQPA